MLVVKALSKGEPTAVHDGCVVTVVADDEVVLGEELGDDAAVYGKAGGEHQGLVFANEFGKLPLKLYVDVQGAVEETGAGATGTVFLEGFDAGIDDAFVAGKACICVGAEHHDLVTIHGDLSSLFGCNLAEVGINALLNHFLGKVIFCQSGV